MRRLLAPVLLVVACTGVAPKSRPAPTAEFLVAAGDSTYWVTAGRDGVRLRGAPITLARYGGRFYEVYVADDDRSFYDAVFVGQRIYRRDLVSDDSMLVFDDPSVTRLALAYSAQHPDERPLSPDEDASDEPASQASGEIDIVDVHGPYLSFEYRRDVDVDGERSEHLTRRAVIDLRTGRVATLESLFGDSAARAIEREGRRRFVAVADSVRAARDTLARRAALTLPGFHFDAGSFGLTGVERAPAVAFLVPGRGEGAGGLGLMLSPVVVRAPDWWDRETSAALPESTTDASADRWRGPGGLQVLAAYDAEGTVARLTLRDSARHDWPVGHIAAPARRLYWLGRTTVDSVARRALQRAFDEGALYSDETRTASWRRDPSTSKDGARRAGIRGERRGTPVRSRASAALVRHGGATSSTREPST